MLTLSARPLHSDLAKAATKRRAEQTLKLQTDDEAFSHVYGHESHPFDVKRGQKIAIRVLSQFGKETTKVLEVKQACQRPKNRRS